MNKHNIYHDRNQDLFQIFEQAGDHSKLMCVPIDYAKKDHMAMFCNGYGDILRKPFNVKNSPEGVDYLIDQTMRSCRHRHIKQQHVFFGGEDVNSYAENFVNALRSEGFLVASVNAYDAKKQRDNHQASTDRLDLTGIANMLLSCRANTCPAQSGAYRKLRTLVRYRKKLVKTKTGVRNQIHKTIDKLFPGFLNEKKSGITPFSRSCLYLMANRFSVPQIRRRRRSSLIENLRKYGTKKPEEAAAKLQDYATKVLTPPSEYVATLQVALSCHVDHMRCLINGCEKLEKEMAALLAQTQGAFLTSIKGIGMVLASGVTSEIGDPFSQKSCKNLVSYAGIIPKVKQTGGVEGQPRKRRVSKRCNHILKDYVVQSANHIGRCGPDDLLQDYKRRDATGQHADFGIARRFLRMSLCLMRTSQIYLPPHLRTSEGDLGERAEYYLSHWPYLRDKWNKFGAAKAAFTRGRPLGEWRYFVQAIYKIKLKL